MSSMFERYVSAQINLTEFVIGSTLSGAVSGEYRTVMDVAGSSRGRRVDVDVDGYSTRTAYLTPYVRMTTAISPRSRGSLHRVLCWKNIIK